jgi:hypothetical protein
MTQALEQRTYAREEYLDFETAAEKRHEYVKANPTEFSEPINGCGFPVAEPPQRGLAIFTPIPI